MPLPASVQAGALHLVPETSEDRAMPPSDKPIPPHHRLHTASVVTSRLITLEMRRVTLRCDDLSFLGPHFPTAWVKVFLPSDNGVRPVGRAYTIQAIRPDQNELDIDFVVHDHGPLGTWASAPKPGDALSIAGPRGKFSFAANARNLLIGGDETALPAIGSILAAAPAGLGITTIIESAPCQRPYPLNPRGSQKIVWLDRAEPHGAGLLEKFRTTLLLNADPDHLQIWMAGESGTIARMRSLVTAMQSTTLPLYASGYWKHGEGDHRDPLGTE